MHAGRGQANRPSAWVGIGAEAGPPPIQHRHLKLFKKTIFGGVPIGVDRNPAKNGFLEQLQAPASHKRGVPLRRRFTLLPSNSTAAETKTVLEPLGDGQFRMMAPTGGGAIGEVVRFDETPGRPARLYLGDTWAQRVDAF